MDDGTGFIDWPAVGCDGWVDGSYAGMWVYAFVPVERSLSMPLNLGREPGEDLRAIDVDPFVQCDGADMVIMLPMPEALVGERDTDVQIYPASAYAQVFALPVGSDDREQLMQNFGADVLAAVCLGTCGRVPERDGRPFFPGHEDLSLQGRQLMVLLRELYDRPVHLVAFLEN